MTYVIYPQNAQPAAGQLGGKAGALAALQQAGLPIPAWIALAPAAFADSRPKSDALDALAPAPQVLAELLPALARLCPNGELVAVRSSALDEDGAQHSFAGQLESFLNVPPQQAAEKVADVWRSGFSPRVLAYRRERGLSPTPQAPAVLIQRMVKADFSGVAFSADPVSNNRDLAVVATVPGLGDALVSGQTDADTFHVNRRGEIVSRAPVSQPNPNGRGEQGSRGAGEQPRSTHHALRATQPETQNSNPAYPPQGETQNTLTDAQIQAIAALARRTEQFFGRPQDIEWAIEDGQLYLLQSRPITTLPPAPNPNGALNLWDNSNIAESYPGVTTPLTFSFARRAYEEVYRQFCYLMGVPQFTIAANQTTFKRMLGLIQGRIYYNLLSWYRVLAMLPGYKLNRRFMEQMMGLKESLPDELLDAQTPSRSDRLRDALRLLRTLAGLLVNYLLLPRRIKNFYDRLHRALGDGRPDLSQYRPDELVAYYRQLEGQLLTRWDAPLVNDFFAMIFYGLLRGLAQKWCGDTHGTLQNSLLAGSGNIISAEPARRMRHLAQVAATDPHFTKMLGKGTLAQILADMPRLPEFEAQYQDYLDKFGDRCLEELKLESPTLHDDPLLLLRSVGQLAKAQRSRGAEEQRSEGAGRQSPNLPITNPLRRLIFNWVLKNARRLVRHRENLRFERTRLFGRARQIFVELGRRFHKLDLLADPRDIFYLEVEEALGLVDSTTTTAHLKGLVDLRRAEFDRYQKIEAPPGRIETRGIPARSLEFPPGGDRQGSGFNPQPATLKGLGCSPGVVRGPVRVVRDPKTASLQPGDILVAERTDPGWVMLFPIAAGLLVEHGSLLSHSAIVSRELGLPAIVSLKGVTGWLQDGDWVEFDGSTGEVVKLEGTGQ